MVKISKLSFEVDREWIDMLKAQSKIEGRTMKWMVIYIMKEYCEGRMRWKEKWE